ncbi:50S ribosomal protein L22 [Candidatus Uhrbacteria bacterium]|nr:50S ribosomal protein L22 [Candidatus Uhrbacteria bacterium]
MQAVAHLRHLRMSPRKVRLVADLIRGLDVAEADAQLAHLSKAASLPVRKLLASAVANAEHNAKLSRDNLFVQQIFVNQGATLKRSRPRAFGRAAAIRKRSAHISLVLDERVPTPADSRKPTAVSRSVAPPVVMMGDRPRVRAHAPHVHGAAPETMAPTAQSEAGKEPFDVHRKGKHRHPEHEESRGGKHSGGFFKKLFNRRSGER